MSLPGIITAYDGKKGTVRPLIDLRYKDGSYIPFSEIEDVPILSPATAFAGIKVPIRVGDKVIIHISDGDIQKLLFDSKTAGLDDPGNTQPCSSRSRNLTDVVAYTGFQSLEDMIPSDHDVWIFNNRTEDSYTHVRLKADGAIELKTLSASIKLHQDGTVDIVAPLGLNVEGPINATGIITSDIDCVSATISGIAHIHNHGEPTTSAPIG
jgi:hypothetical protein